MELQYKLVTAPTTEPVTVAEAKSQARFELATEDTLISQMIAAARTRV